MVFDSSTGFKLSNGAVRSPDVSWIAIEKWNSLSDEQKRVFARGLQAPEFDSGDSPSPIAPDFVIELMSPTDSLYELQQKMNEYISCGVRLGWLINSDEKQVEIDRYGQQKKVINSPISLSGEDVLPKLTVGLAEIL